MKAVKDFIFPGSKITTVNDCSHKIKRCLLLGRKAMTNVDSILKSRDTTLPSKVREWDHQKKKKSKHQRIDPFKLWCWRGLLRVPWTAKSSNQSILKEINPKYSLEGLILKLRLQYFGHLIHRADYVAGKN